MVSHRLRVLFAGGLLCFGGLTFAQSASVDGPVETDAWGDPGDDENGSERAWTWFGLGYENRAQTSFRPVDAGGAAVNGTGADAGTASGRAGHKAKGRGRNQ